MTDAASARQLDIEPRHRRSKRRERRGISIGGIIIGMVLGVLGWIVVTNMIPSLNPFKTETRDYSAPVMLEELRDIAEFHAAQAQFQVTIDQEDDVKYVPSVIAGERVQYLAVGYIDGFVEFGDLGEEAIKIDEGTNSVTIDLPPAQMSPAVIDMNLSHVMNRDRGILDRVGGVFEDNPTGEQELIQLAQDKMTAAANESDLIARTETNTAEMLVSLVGAMGFDEVNVTFAGSEPQSFVTPGEQPGATIGADQTDG